MEIKKSIMHDVIGENPKACKSEVIPEGFGEFGYEKTNPIPIYGIDNIDTYMSQLRYETISNDGSSIFLPVQYLRTIEDDNSAIGTEMPKNEIQVGSTFANNIGNNIDVYNIYTFDGAKKLGKLFIHCYHYNTSSKVPKGFFRDLDYKKIENSLNNLNEISTSTIYNDNLESKKSAKKATTLSIVYIVVFIIINMIFNRYNVIRRTIENAIFLIIITLVFELIIFLWKKYIKKHKKLELFDGINDFVETAFVYFLLFLGLNVVGFLIQYFLHM